MQAQIDETLEEINPRCVIELLALPLGDEFQSKRGEGLQGVRNILWSVGGGGAAAIAGGFTREDFMNEAFLRMTAAEQVNVFNLLCFVVEPKIFAQVGICGFTSFFFHVRLISLPPRQVTYLQKVLKFMEWHLL